MTTVNCSVNAVNPVGQNGAQIYAADSGTANTYVVALSPAPLTLIAGFTVRFLAANANTGASTLNVNSLGAKAIKKSGTAALVANDIVANEMIVVIYDGTSFQMVSPPGSIASGSNLSDNISQTSHGFSVGNVLYYNGSAYALAEANSVITAEVVGIVTNVIDVNDFALTTYGYITGLSGLTAGDVYFLSDITAYYCKQLSLQR